MKQKALQKMGKPNFGFNRHANAAQDVNSRSEPNADEFANLLDIYLSRKNAMACRSPITDVQVESNSIEDISMDHITFNDDQAVPVFR